MEKLSTEVASRNTAAKTELTIFSLNESLDKVTHDELSKLKSIIRNISY